MELAQCERGEGLPLHKKVTVKDYLTTTIFVYYHQQAPVADFRLHATIDVKSRLFVISPIKLGAFI